MHIFLCREKLPCAVSALREYPGETLTFVWKNDIFKNNIRVDLDIFFYFEKGETGHNMEELKIP